MEFLENDPDTAWKYRNLIISQVSIVELMNKYGLQLESKITGQEFTHRCFCPFHKGKGNNGRERTPSMFVSDITNSFFCFSCNATGTVINFVSLVDGTPPLIALQKLAKDIGIMDKDGKWDELKLDSLEFLSPVFDPQKTIEPYLLEIGNSIRGYIKKFIRTSSFEKEFKWTQKVGEKVDEFLSNIGHEDWEYAKNLADKVKKSISKRNKNGEL